MIQFQVECLHFHQLKWKCSVWVASSRRASAALCTLYRFIFYTYKVTVNIINTKKTSNIGDIIPRFCFLFLLFFIKFVQSRHRHLAFYFSKFIDFLPFLRTRRLLSLVLIWAAGCVGSEYEPMCQKRGWWRWHNAPSGNTHTYKPNWHTDITLPSIKKYTNMF